MFGSLDQHTKHDIPGGLDDDEYDHDHHQKEGEDDDNLIGGSL